MASWRVWLTMLLCVAGSIGANDAKAWAQAPTRVAPAAVDKPDRLKAAVDVPLAELPERFRDGVKITIEKPALYSQGPVETFACEPPFYYWLLEHPDLGVAAWRRLGAQCV